MAAASVGVVTPEYMPNNNIAGISKAGVALASLRSSVKLTRLFAQIDAYVKSRHSSPSAQPPSTSQGRYHPKKTGN